VSFNEDFVSKVCNAFKKAVESASSVTLEGREREFRHVLARYFFDETLGWEGHSKIGEIYDITCFDDENFPIIDIETKWGVEPTSEIKEKLRKRIEELGSVRYGVFASERDFIVYEYADYKLKEITKINVAEATGVARGEYGLSEDGTKRILKLEMLKRERLVWIEDPDYFEKTYKEISIAKERGVKLLTDNLRAVVSDLTTVLMNFFDAYHKRGDHYSGIFLENTFNDWLRISMKEEEFKKVDKKEEQTRRRKIIEVFCRETAYVLLGRILFTRICEDKEIIETMISGKGIAESLRYYGKRDVENAYFRLFNESREEIKKYYSHLHELGFFDWWLIEEVKRGTLINDEKTIQDHLEKDLDYSIKKTFRRLNRFDFTRVNRDILGDVYQGYLPPEERKRLGEFYTPKKVIEYILNAVDYKPKNEIQGRKILDPACGSGGFLVEATQRLIERYRILGLHLQDPNDARQIVEECVNQIYGLDIHPFACFIAEMNLIFQLIDLYDAIRRKDRYYKLPRLNIYRTDSLIPPGETSVDISGFFENSRRKMLIEETKGADRIKRMRFEYVVGNPPYVRVDNISESYRKAYTNIFKDLFAGKWDIYIPFIYKGIEWLIQNRKFGYIVSNKFFLLEHGLPLRNYLLEKCLIDEIIDLSGVGVFAESLPAPAVIIMQKRSNKMSLKHKIKASVITDSLLSAPMRSELKEAGRIMALEKALTYFLDNLHFYEVTQDRFKQDSELLFTISIPDEMMPLIKKLETGCRTLGEICEGKIDEGDTKREEEKYVLSIEKYEELPESEKVSYEKVLRGVNVKRYVAVWDNLYIKSLSETSKKPKLLIKDYSKKLTVAYDDGKFRCLRTIYCAYLRDSSLSLKYVLALLNSTLLHFYYLAYFYASRPGKGSFRFRTQFLKRLPIKYVDSTKQEQIVQLVERIISTEMELLHLKSKISHFPEPYFEDDWGFDKLMNLIKAQSLSKSLYTISDTSLRTNYLKDLYGKETFRINLASDEFLDFSSEEVASCVLEVLKTMNRITKRELLELKIPKQPYLKNLMNQYRKDKEQIVKNEKAVKELEKQIDDLVYKLYDITYAERRIIEDYLKKF